ncbi:hypothetical protein [Polymorphobacter sp.]|uniref:hypothetical protein n=1 Tax=Polymorphobacter sp. TaxID=1909290 RepID=UPI003F6EA39E
MTRTYRGTISYGHDVDGLTGREHFYVTVHDDGSRTLRCICEMDKVPLVRDVVYSVNERFEALDGFVRLSAEGAFIGSGWFRFTDSLAEGEMITAKEGRVSQRIETPGRVRLMGAHPISIDIWKCAHVEAARQGEVQTLSNCFSTSLVPNGASGPILVTKTYDITYQGHETIEVPAGRFDCERFSWNTYTGRTLVMHSMPGDWLPVSVHVPETGRRYQLTDFERLD